ncbi:thioesterase [Chromobacterium sp. ATCC 53434]|uniref:thioesterase II family protein n=1 Tax=Chromobacterium sp. (strain ATCC 53434 / SC 14030) TaxID=2059672 RepID=UPI000C76B3A8|nr:alpha/beta fold hydrolase [Chromobacterium sp. ATCC 53434]AUH50743.1 thioesterase [Chromobacterium sp. ATCC 53434]
MHHPSPWILRHGGGPRPRLRLYCFPYAGGHAGIYTPWQGKLHPDVEICAVQLPGRGARFRDPGFKSLPPLIEELARELPLDGAVPFAFFGHSMGSLIAFELARRLQTLGRPLPRRLFVSGCDAPQHRQAPRGLHQLDDAGFIEALRDYQGTPAEILANRELMELLLPSLRDDFQLVESYRYHPGAPLTMPTTVLAGRDDRQRLPEQTEGWQRETTGPSRVHWFDGGHFFIASAREAVLARVNAELAELLPAAPRPVALL